MSVPFPFFAGNVTTLSKSGRGLVPALLDLEEETLYMQQVNNNTPGTRLTVTSYQRQRIQQHIRDRVSNKTHTILWFNGPDYFNLENINSMNQRCLYSNCISTSDKSFLKKSSAILFCTTCEKMGRGPPLKIDERPANQVWVIFSNEPPHNHLYQDDFRHHLWKDTINWSMTYRQDSDIFMPYGYLQSRSHIPERNYSEIFRRKTKFAAWVVSHCGASSMRDSFVRKLQGYGLPIDIYGKCGTPLEEHAIHMINNTYKFYLSLENAYCKDYVTEKFFNYFRQDTIVIARGGAEYGKLLPNDSFIDASHFRTTKELVDFLLFVNSSETLYANFLKKKDRYEVKTDYQPSFCDLCAKVNNKERNKKIYHDIVEYIYTDQCHIANDVTNTWVYCIILFIAFFLYVVYVTFHKYNWDAGNIHKLPKPNF